MIDTQRTFSTCLLDRQTKEGAGTGVFVVGGLHVLFLFHHLQLGSNGHAGYQGGSSL